MTLEERLDYYLAQKPRIDSSAYIASGSVVVGSVSIGAHSSIWHNVVVRGDINTITIGECTNVQDTSVIHLADDYGVEIGNYVTIGHMAMIHACKIEDECLIGMNATIMDGAVIGEQSIVAAGSLVTKGKRIPPGSLVLGSPAKVIRKLDENERRNLKKWAQKYVIVARKHKSKQTT